LISGVANGGTDLVVTVEGELVSKPYIAMTLRVMEAFGADVSHEDFRRFVVAANAAYHGCRYAIEPDASAASYFWAAAAITGGQVTVEGLGKDSLQGDVQFVECLRQMGCDVRYDVATDGTPSITVSGRATRGIEIDMNAISDTVQTLAAVALFTKTPTTIHGVGHIRHKETDRIGDLARELRKFGASVTETLSGFTLLPPPDIRHHRDITIETYNDHRMAMSLALPGLFLPGVTILNPGCTEKTYPRFFDDLERLAGSSGQRVAPPVV
jgi:3-phosphoshikimate 1-carboxyvinyltransferase